MDSEERIVWLEETVALLLGALDRQGMIGGDLQDRRADIWCRLFDRPPPKPQPTRLRKG